jgi:hypothetical protein
LALSTVAAILVPKAVASSAAAGNMQEAEVIYIYIYICIYVQCMSRKTLHLQQPRVTCRIVNFVSTIFYFSILVPKPLHPQQPRATSTRRGPKF